MGTDEVGPSAGGMGTGGVTDGWRGAAESRRPARWSMLLARLDNSVVGSARGRAQHSKFGARRGGGGGTAAGAAVAGGRAAGRAGIGPLPPEMPGDPPATAGLRRERAARRQGQGRGSRGRGQVSNRLAASERLVMHGPCAGHVARSCRATGLVCRLAHVTSASRHAAAHTGPAPTPATRITTMPPCLARRSRLGDVGAAQRSPDRPGHARPAPVDADPLARHPRCARRRRAPVADWQAGAEQPLARGRCDGCGHASTTCPRRGVQRAACSMQPCPRHAPCGGAGCLGCSDSFARRAASGWKCRLAAGTTQLACLPACLRPPRPAPPRFRPAAAPRPAARVRRRPARPAPSPHHHHSVRRSCPLPPASPASASRGPASRCTPSACHASGPACPSLRRPRRRPRRAGCAPPPPSAAPSSPVPSTAPPSRPHAPTPSTSVRPTSASTSPAR